MPRIRVKFPCPFDKLPKRLQEKVVEDNYNWNVEDRDWWDCTYEDAERIGLKITGFDDYRAEGKLTETVEECCRLIKADHGPDCDTYKLAEEYEQLLQVERLTWACLEPDHDFEEGWEIEDSFKRELLKCYKRMLDADYEYQTSEEAIRESLEANDHIEWDHEGRMA